jgi:hypothetical protein
MLYVEKGKRVLFLSSFLPLRIPLRPGRSRRRSDEADDDVEEGEGKDVKKGRGKGV